MNWKNLPIIKTVMSWDKETKIGVIITLSVFAIGFITGYGLGVM